MKRPYPAVVAFAVLALLLGALSAWPLSSLAAWGSFVLHSAVLLAAFLVFFRYLPRVCGLPVQILVAMIAGVLAGWCFAFAGDAAFISDYLGIFGKLFILLLTVVVIPLIFVSVLCGVAGIGDVRKLGRLGAKALIYYFCTTAISVTIGLTVVNALHPGAGHAALIEETQQQQNTADATPSIGQKIQNSVLPMIIQNPIMAGQNPIVVIFFALLLGAALATLGPQGEPALQVFRALDHAFVTIIMWVMVLAPLGVFALMAKVIAELGVAYVVTLAKYFFTVVLGLALHFGVLTLVIIPLLGRISPRRFLRGMLPVFEVSFSTSSSVATLPVTRECARRIGADVNIGNFMLPLGATINMDGTALYVTVASIFISQVYGMHLGFQAQFMVFLTAVLVSVGTAGIPGASIGLMSIILAAAGIPIEGIGMVIGVDRLLDMSRTLVNVTGDAVGTVVVSRSEGAFSDTVPED